MKEMVLYILSIHILPLTKTPCQEVLIYQRNHRTTWLTNVCAYDQQPGYDPKVTYKSSKKEHNILTPF